MTTGSHGGTDPGPVPPRAVLVTGASTGIGRDIAARLAARGHAVFAGARRRADLEALGAIENVTPLELDVTRPDHVEAALRAVEALRRGLAGLVNNAGVGGLGPLATFTDGEVAGLLDVNVLGPHRLTNAFTGMLIESRGRIVNIGSQGGTVTSAYFGPYCMSKHALEAYTAVLHDELRPHGVHVSIVQPGAVVSRIGENALAPSRARLRRAPAPFREAAQELLARLLDPAPYDPGAPESDENRYRSPPAVVSDAVEHALFSASPRRRYLVGTTWEGERVIDTLIDRLLDAAGSPSHGYSREQLVARIDRHRQRREQAGGGG